jgi:hypothetical protein
MEKTTVYSYETQGTRAAVYGLAVVGFLALVFIGIMLAIYASRYVPEALTKLSFLGHGDSGLSVVPTTTLPFPGGAASSTPATTTPAVTKPATTTPAKTGSSQAAAATIGYKTVITDYPTPGSVKIPSNSAQNLSGLPNLTTTVIAVGYLDKDQDFVADKTVDNDDELAVKFRVTNTGTNVSGVWNLQVLMPTKNNDEFEYDSDPQHSLNPGDYNDYIVSLNKNQARVDDEDRITITADPDDKIKETSERDNTQIASVSVDE